MMLQEEIVFDEYFRCYAIGRKDVRIMQYDPRQPHHLRYVQDAPPIDPALLERVHDDVLTLNQRPRLRLQHRRVRGARRHPLRHRLLQPGAGRRRRLDRRGELRLGGRGAAEWLIRSVAAARRSANNYRWATYLAGGEDAGRRRSARPAATEKPAAPARGRRRPAPRGEA